MLCAVLGAPFHQAAAQVDAQPPLTLAEARAAARRASLEIRAAREAVAAAVGRERQAGVLANPRLSWSREQASGSGLSNGQMILAAEQPFEIGGVRSARTRAARLRREAAEARLAAAELQADFDATRAFALAAAAERRAALATQVTDAFRMARDVSEKRLAAGDVSGYAARRVRLEAVRYAALRAEATLSSRESRMVLASLLARDLDVRRPLELAPVDPAQAAGEVPSADSLGAAALRLRADVRVAELEASAAAADARVVTLERTPVPVFQAGVKTETQMGGRKLAGFVAGISMPVPVFDRRRGAVEAADAEARRRDAEAALVRRRVSLEVAEAREAFVAAREQVALLAPQLGVEAERAMRAAQVAYTEGEISLVEWLDAARAYQEAEASFATLRAEVLVRQAALERAVGAPLALLSTGNTTPNRGTGR